jgi:hypothetical protein
MYPNTLKIHMVCVTYIQHIYFFQHSFSYFIYLSYVALNKNEIRVKPGICIVANRYYIYRSIYPVNDERPFLSNYQLEWEISGPAGR